MSNNISAEKVTLINAELQSLGLLKTEDKTENPQAYFLMTSSGLQVWTNPDGFDLHKFNRGGSTALLKYLQCAPLELYSSHTDAFNNVCNFI